MRMKLDQLTIRHLQRLFPACHPGIGRTNDFRFNLPLRFLRSLQQEAQGQIKAEIIRAANPRMTCRKQALQMANCKLVKLHSHVAASRCIFNDLRTLRRLSLEEREKTIKSATDQRPTISLSTTSRYAF